MITTIAELDKVRDECREMVKRRSLASAGAAVVPIPGLDLAADIGLLSDMLPAISKRFGLAHEQVQKLDPRLAERVLVLASSIGNTMIGRAVTKRLVVAVLRRLGARIATASAAKYVPFVGSAVAAGVSYGAMRLAGNSHIDDCYATAKQLIADGTALPAAGE